jgi:hypothetical protein
MHRGWGAGLMVAIVLWLLSAPVTARASAWRTVAAPSASVSVPRDASLAAVSCASASMCMAAVP